MWVVVSSRHSFQLSCRHQFTGQHIGSALDTLSAVVGELHLLLVELDTVTEDAEHGTCSHDVGVETLFFQRIVLRQSSLIHQIHGFLHRVFDVLVIWCQCEEIMMENSDGTVTTSEFSDRDYTEDTTASHNSNYKNAIAKDIEAFETSVKNNHGYYIGRYEAGVVDYDSSVSTSNSNNKTNWTGYTGDNIKLVCKKEQQVWNYVTQNKASELSRDMYGSEAKVTSDLINSYAWDTAIVFIQECGTESNSSTYSRTWGHSSITEGMPQATGTNILTETSKVDKQCNIFDMAGNCLEWTTETYSSSNGYRRTLRYSRR